MSLEQYYVFSIINHSLSQIRAIWRNIIYNIMIWFIATVEANAENSLLENEMLRVEQPNVIKSICKLC